MSSHAHEERQTSTPRIYYRSLGYWKPYRIFDRLLLRNNIVCI
jgi:hypothetical protein